MTRPGPRLPSLERLLSPGPLLALVAVLYLPTLGFPFLSLDDQYAVVTNPGIRDLSWESVWFLFFEDRRDFRYFPLTYLSFAVDYALFGLDASGYHAVNVLLHLANTALVFVAIRSLFGDRLAAGLAALLFGIHPLQVESVAWVMGRKNVLFMLFFLLSLLAYLRYARPDPGGAHSAAGRAAALAGSVALFFLAMTAKPAAVTLPAVLVLVDHHLRPEPPHRLLAFLGRSLPTKLLYVPVIAFSWLMTRRLAAQNPFGAEISFDAWSWVVITFHNLGFYVAKAVAPVRLGVFYPLPLGQEGLLPWPFYALALLGLAVVAVCVWSWLRRRRTLFFATAWYLGTILPMALLPVIFRDYPLLAADRYFYQSAIGLFLGVGVAFASAWRRVGASALRAALALLLAAVAAGTFLASWQQRAVWRGVIPLYEQTVRHHPSDAFYNRLALAYARQGRMAPAFRALENAEQAPRQIFFGHLFSYQMGLSDLYRRKEEYGKAARLLASAIESAPNALEPQRADSPLAFRYLAHLYARAGDPDRAEAARQRAREARPAPGSYFERVWFAVAPAAAGAFLERRVAQAPHDGMAWYYLGRWHELGGRPERARRLLRRARDAGFLPPEGDAETWEGISSAPARPRAAEAAGR